MLYFQKNKKRLNSCGVFRFPHFLYFLTVVDESDQFGLRINALYAHASFFHMQCEHILQV